MRSPLLILGALALAVPVRAQSSDGLTVRVVRFYRTDGQKTTVKAFVEVPGQLAEPMEAGRTDSTRYRVSLKVVDAAGVTLYTEAWGKTLANTPGASGLDIVDFLVAPGKYRLEATVMNAAGQPRAQAGIAFEGYTEPPQASDLLLAPMMRLTDNATDTVPRAGEMLRGNTLISATAELRLTPLRPRAYYLLEAYNPGDLDQTGSMSASVVDSSGHTLTKSQPVAVRIGPGGGLLKGQVDLEGLPEGRYQLKVSVDLGGRMVERAASFSMAPFAATIERNAVIAQAIQATDEGFFGGMSEGQLDSVAAPLVYVARADERPLLRGFSKLTPNAKRKFLTEFWQKRDTDGIEGRNEARERFYDLIEFTNRSFSEGTRRAQPGWRTDRGRIYAKNGAPDDVLRRPSAGTVPYEVWRYTRGKNRYYVFADRTAGIGAYNLLQTNDLTENSYPGWREILQEAAVQDIGRYVGVDFYSGEATGR